MRGLGVTAAPRAKAAPTAASNPNKDGPPASIASDRHRCEFGDQAAQDPSGTDLDPEVDAIGGFAHRLCEPDRRCDLAQ